MAKVRFQNGAEATSELLLDEEIEDGASASDAKKQLKELADHYGTVEDAAAWLDGSPKPAHLGQPAEAVIPQTSRLLESVPTAPPSPEAQAEEVAAAEAAAAEVAAAEEKAVAENLAAREEIAKAAAEKEAAKKKKSDG